MNLQYSGTKRTLAKDRESVLVQVGGNKVDKTRAEAVNTLVDAFLKDKSIADSAVVSVNAVLSTNAISINITLDQATFIAAQPVVDESKIKPFTKAQIKTKHDANAKSVTKNVTRIKPTKEQIEAGQPS